jgi:hypothetical protein
VSLPSNPMNARLMSSLMEGYRKSDAMLGLVCVPIGDDADDRPTLTVSTTIRKVWTVWSVVSLSRVHLGAVLTDRIQFPLCKYAFATPQQLLSLFSAGRSSASVHT